jgi:hypothetical protein
MASTSDRLRFVAVDQIDFGVDVLDCLEVIAKLLANIDTVCVCVFDLAFVDTVGGM